jgi:hypothetical protein
MIVRVIKGRKWIDYTCAQVSQDTYDDGIDIILWELDGKPNQQKTIMLPQHGKKVFFMNDKGDTTHCVTWPPKEQQS